MMHDSSSGDDDLSSGDDDSGSGDDDSSPGSSNNNMCLWKEMEESKPVDEKLLFTDHVLIFMLCSFFK
ncbi:hypothetical protein DY000_02000700 [Brassica cretica]|uniref:Uncharacterized protein n=1 Tax=Brassica cretica TaxID=69181 RepID=A0ABQ7C560_BRACR|nr:hypothetical protein DY000_02000700 [Brassica cretica]